ncbi:MAG TPA: PQQ-binding-like beta-propeller repeat protein [Bacteroidales bacterium]|nr:PQQ-binding-like beta-propeller repeat protein [Bacteroidales bacterium]
MNKTTIALVAGILCSSVIKAQLYEWRGPQRTGVYNETGLLKQWPSGGPKLIWEYNDSGFGYSSATITDDAIYITGRKGSDDVITALTLDGKKKWELAYGKAWTTNHDGTRCTPTYYNGNIFLVSGSGDIVCVGSDGKLKWTKNHFSLYGSKPLSFGISESPLVVDNLVIATPGGKKASLVAFNINDGKVAWEAEPIDAAPQYVNPLLVEYGGKKIIITVLSTYIVGVNAKDGKILWKEDYAAANAKQPKSYENHAVTPTFRNGELLIANGYNWIALKFKLSPDGTSISRVWENTAFDPQLGGVVLVGNHVYGSTHEARPVDSWACVDWTTGKTLWTQKWYSKGSIISADGMLYLFEERSGHVGLAKPNPAKLEIVSEFQVNKGDGPYWAHPAIKNGRIYIRHGSYLGVYQVK